MADSLITLSGNLSSPGNAKASDFKEQKNGGEDGTAVSVGVSVDLKDGKWTCPYNKK